MATPSVPYSSQNKRRNSRAAGKSKVLSSGPSKKRAPLPTASIVVMGATGSGKSSFINLISQSKLQVSDRLGSCTQDVEIGPSFELDGRAVTLIDTPGFDDTDKSDAEVLKIIVAFLEAHYRQGAQLHGVLYLHRITDNRMGGVSTRSFNIFRKLCGDSALKNVVIVTNMWNKISPAEGEAREVELTASNRFFKPALDKGGKILRHDNTVPSAQIIIRSILGNSPMTLAVQHELVDLCRHFHSTETGREIIHGLDDAASKHLKDLESLQEELGEAIAARDNQAARELRGVQHRTNTALAKIRHETKNLVSDYRKQRLRASDALRRRTPMQAARNEAGSCCFVTRGRT